MKKILGKKIGMTQIFQDDGTVVPVTVVEAGPLTVVQKKTVEKEGYNAIQVGFSSLKERKANKPRKGHFAKSHVEVKKFLREFRVDNIDEYEIGQEIKADIFVSGERVDVAGTSKGKGTQGPIKRYGHGRGPETHGSKYHRAVGGMSAGTYPGRVLKGKKMSGHMGNERVTVQNLEVVKVDADKNLILIKGAVPGPKSGLLLIKSSVKA
ncbi:MULTISPECIES: 50S ribosomal protein L3 [Tissierellales]|jgi:large subunit ribosomal protein L3|uniref:Large ribosomal subunit protein uL3 n=1 Tax=Acidilutibacter cellobiosedens TaxID=2507161 RepID=A0A410QF25_9FIRM|nr:MULTISPECIES: 50S ribosomal protein L3 [Tissierellales]MBE6082736.1 50S ribosomal protein L3 [Tissierellaceae bacterium]QAT62673.1 50S ribosomal protein L3 [Acidilutibacter cellobiosedens]SCL90109.1 50S ribosomal protein L3 [Sporanaerobacter sp. PP17-6a]